MSEAFVGIDLGTQSVRVLVVSPAGDVMGAGQSPLSSHRDRDRHEQSPHEWWAAVGTAVRMAIADLDVRLQGVAVCATSGTVLLIDEKGESQGPAVMYDDARAGAQADRLNEVGGDVWARHGYHRMQAVWGAPKILWLQQQSSSTGRPVTQADFVNQRLCGEPVAADVSNSLKSGCDAAALSWPLETFEAAGMRTHDLPDLVLPGTRLGTVGTVAADETGLPVGLPVLAGMTDGCAAQIASGAVAPGSWNGVLGTTLALKGVNARAVSDPHGVVYSHRSSDGRWLPGGASSVGAAALEVHLPGCSHADLTHAAASRLPSSILTYPLAAPRGERFPFVAPEAGPLILGHPRDPADLYAGLLQGVALVERLCLDYLHLVGADVSGQLHLTGGAAANSHWNQLRADASGRTAVVPEVTEPAMGMAVLVAAAPLGGLAVATAAMVRVSRTYEPNVTSTWSGPAYARLVDELESRGWLPAATAAHARTRIAT